MRMPLILESSFLGEVFSHFSAVGLRVGFPREKEWGETIEHLDSNDPVREFLTTPCARGQRPRAHGYPTTFCCKLSGYRQHTVDRKVIGVGSLGV